MISRLATKRITYSQIHAHEQLTKVRVSPQMQAAMGLLIGNHLSETACTINITSSATCGCTSVDHGRREKMRENKEWW